MSLGVFWQTTVCRGRAGSGPWRWCGSSTNFSDGPGLYLLPPPEAAWKSTIGIPSVISAAERLLGLKLAMSRPAVVLKNHPLPVSGCRLPNQSHGALPAGAQHEAAGGTFSGWAPV